MLQHGLYDVSDAADNRFNGAFTAYISSNSSPYLYMNTSGFIRDYTTMSHEFGHFLDGYINYGNDESLAISEISSQALELLTMLKLKGKTFSSDYQYLEYYTMFTFLNSVLLVQSFYSAFEHLAYSLDYDDVTETRLKDLVEDAFTLVYGDKMSIEGDLSYVTMTHTVLYPFYVESYVTSGLVSLDIFFTEKSGKGGEGFKLYEALVNRDNTKRSFTERLEIAGLDTPFQSGKVKEISNSIYFTITGKNHYKDSDNSVDEA
jgi:oligoendopeptidase F